MRIPRPVNDVVLRLLTHRRLRMGRALVGLDITGRRSGRHYRFPVQYAEDRAGLVVVPGQPATKTWWRNLADRPAEIGILLDGRWQRATAQVLQPGDLAYAVACATYQQRYPRPMIARGPIVRVDPVEKRHATAEQTERIEHV